ncbi:hypothetical protein HXX01_00050 [Candidatus Nomurabacteria bacterium]|nr:hypothetical protein [Candidatus Nomurabacteria bacterium]
MTNKTQLLNTEIDKALVAKDFDYLVSFFVNNAFSATEVLIFYKRKIDNTFIFPEFWKSNLPHYFLEKILESDIRIAFYQAYFQKSENCSEELNKHLISISSDEFLKYFKLWNAYKHSDFLNSFRKISSSDYRLEKAVDELDIIIQAEISINEEQKKDELSILQFSFGEIAMAFSVYFYALKQNKVYLNNKSLLTSVEVTLIEELNRIFKLFLGKKNIDFFFKNNEEIQNEFKRNEPPHHLLGHASNHFNLEDKYKLLFRLIDRSIYHNGQLNNIQLFLCGYAEFDKVLTKQASLRTNYSYRSFQINNHKSVAEEYYFIDFKLEDVSSFKMERTEISIALKCLFFYGVPRIFDYQKNTIDIEKVLRLLKYFSAFKGPLERGFLPDNKVINLNQSDDDFRRLFGINESLSIFNYQDLINGIIGYFNWSELEVADLLSFLTFDIDLGNNLNNWLNRPFIKKGNNILWLGSFLKDRRWDNILLNRLKNEMPNQKYKYFSKKLNAENLNTIPRIMELHIEQLFYESGFKTLSGVGFKASNGQSGDYDILAFKDNYLFVCEVKAGTRSDAFRLARYAETVRLEGCAAEQLNKAIICIKEEWNNLKVKLNIDERISLGTVTIIPLIITDYFEGDFQTYKGGIRKVSLLEMEIMFKNKKRELLETYIKLKRITDAQNPKLNHESSLVDNWDLWYGKGILDVKDIVKNIDSNSIWKEIETLWIFDDHTFLIDY